VDPRKRAVADLARLIDGITVVMVTTYAGDGALRSRPMLVERLQDDATLLFLTHRSSHKVLEVNEHPQVNVAFVGPKGDRYVSVSGTGRITHDAEQIRQLWNPTYRAWFPGGSDDPEIGVLTVEIERVEYWDVPSSRLVRLWGVARALASGQPAEAGEHRVFAFGDASPDHAFELE
jgi:general stress protein 26